MSDIRTRSGRWGQQMMTMLGKANALEDDVSAWCDTLDDQELSQFHSCLTNWIRRIETSQRKRSGLTP